jgi:hypothetical protein
MPRFCVNRTAENTGEHEVHNLDADCDRLPALHDWYYLGTHATLHNAVTHAQRIFGNVTGCRRCAPEPNGR